jgi:hypothetical protein
MSWSFDIGFKTFSLAETRARWGLDVIRRPQGKNYEFSVE